MQFISFIFRNNRINNKLNTQHLIGFKDQNLPRSIAEANDKSQIVAYDGSARDKCCPSAGQTTVTACPRRVDTPPVRRFGDLCKF